MAFTSDQIKKVRNAYVTDIFLTDTCPYTKAQLDAAVVAADDWATTNAASFNSALPTPFRTTATSAQKAALLAYVATARWKS